MENETALIIDVNARTEMEDRIANLDDWLRRIRRERRNAILKRGLALIAGCVIAHKALGGNIFPWVMVFAGGGGALLGVGLLTPLREANRDVIALDDVRTLDVLLEARHAPDAVTRDEATAQVKKLLPMLRERDRRWLPASAIREITSLASTGGRYSVAAAQSMKTELDRQLLHLPAVHQLASVPCAEGSISLAALRALEFVGDAHALDAVAYLAEPVGGLRPSEFCREAQRIRPILESRVEADRQKSMLLRPSTSVDEAELLRPASAHTAEPPEQLLRAVNEEPVPEAQTQRT